jgi:hypothetical protein
LDYLEPIPHAVLSLLINIMSYAAVSVSFKGNYRERNYAEMFVDIDKYITNHETLLVERNRLHLDIQKCCSALGEDRTKRALTIFNLKYNIDKKYYDCRCPIYKVCREFINGSHWYGFRQNINIECGQRRQNQFAEVLRILRNKENIIINKKLTDTSNELKKISEQLKNANQELVNKDIQKMNFWIRLHELRTP